MSALPAAELAAYLAAVRALLEELNANAAAGLITHAALPLLSTVDRDTRRLERQAKRDAGDAEGGA